MRNANIIPYCQFYCKTNGRFLNVACSPRPPKNKRNKFLISALTSQKLLKSLCHNFSWILYIIPQLAPMSKSVTIFDYCTSKVLYQNSSTIPAELPAHYLMVFPLQFLSQLFLVYPRLMLFFRFVLAKNKFFFE